VESGSDTDVVRSDATQQRSAHRNGAAPELSTVSVIIDLVRSQGAGLRILEIGSGEVSLAGVPGPDEIVSVDERGRNGTGRRFDERAFDEHAFDCAVSVDTVHRLDPAERRALLARLRRAARSIVMVESPRAINGQNPLEEAIELFREFGDAVLVVADEHLPALFALRELRLSGSSSGRSGAAGPEAIAHHLLGPPAAGSRSVLISIIDADAPGIDVSALKWCCSPPSAEGRDPAGLAVLPLSLEIRRLSDRLDAERAREGRAEAEAEELRRKVAALTRVASEDREARETAEQLVEIVAAARGYRIGLAIHRARATLRRRVGSAWRFVTAPWRAAVARLSEAGRSSAGQ
jgi:hypothetical protein